MKKRFYPIVYKFNFENKPIKVFELLLDQDTITCVLSKKSLKPGWTKLLYHQCTCCSLCCMQHTHCPIAVNIAEVIEAFKDINSSDRCIVYCITPERFYGKKTLVQDGLFSILGIIMATSNCPAMNFLKPMARFHLPFATSQETIFRTTSIHLLRQYFAYNDGNPPDIRLKQLAYNYEKVQEVNRGILDRAANITHQDAEKNAIVILNVLAQLLSMEIDEDLLPLKYLFNQPLN